MVRTHPLVHTTSRWEVGTEVVHLLAVLVVLAVAEAIPRVGGLFELLSHLGMWEHMEQVVPTTVEAEAELER